MSGIVAKLLPAAAVLIGLIAVALFAATKLLARQIDQRHPPAGRFVTVDGVDLHFVDEGPRDAPVVLLIHGASGNLADQIGPARTALGNEFRLIAVDRPGHGWSGRRAALSTPRAQGRLIARLLDELGVKDAVIMGHSFGGAIAAGLALQRPDVVKGLLFVSPATHPWPGGRTNWYNHLAVMPLIGPLFVHTLALPAGLLRLEDGSACVFSPNRMPAGYVRDAGIALVLTPARFRANSEDVTQLYGAVREMAPLYRTITAPTIIITGDRDTVVFEEIHSQGLAHDIPGAKLLVVENLGHKPDHIAADLVAEAVRVLHGRDGDLDAMRARVAARIKDDAFGPVIKCPEPKLPPD